VLVYIFHVPLRPTGSACADYGDQIPAVLVDELFGSEGNGYNSKSGIEYLQFWLDPLAGNRRDGYNTAISSLV
jgi:hypothetical protein